MSTIIEIISILFLSVFQSIFGIGLLLFGTPLFLYLEYSFINTLSLLLPTSITISLIQFLNCKNIDYKFVKETNYFCIPMLLIFLYITLNFEEIIDFKFWVSLMLFLSSLVIIFKEKFLSVFDKIFKLRKFVLMFIGIVHGTTNMGGSFLSIFSSALGGHNKLLTRQYISYGYLSMGVIQYTILIALNYSSLNFYYTLYALVGLLVYFPSQKIFNYIVFEIYVRIIGFIAMMFGLVLLFSSYT